MSLTYLASNKFWVGSCVERRLNISEKEVYEGEMATLISHEDSNFKLMFPIREKDAKMLKLIMEEEMDASEEQDILGLFLTMVDSWKSSDRIMAGAVLDSFFDQDLETDVFLAHFFLANREGYIESMVKSNFSQVLILSAIEESPIFVSEALLGKLLGAPPEKSNDDGHADKIIEIAQEIMNPKPKKVKRKPVDKEGKKNEKSEKNAKNDSKDGGDEEK